MTDDLSNEEITLDELFRRAAAAERFSMLGSVKASGLLSELNENAELAQLSIEELVNIGAARIHKYCADTPQLYTAIIKLFSDLFTPAESPQPLPVSRRRKQKHLGIADKNHSKVALPGVESIEATQRLLTLVEKFSRLPNRVEFEERRIEEFWDPSWPHAPFEQSLKIKQIFSLDIYSLVRKRSMSPQKTAALIQAVERAYAVYSGEAAPDSIPILPAVRDSTPVDSIDSRWSRESLTRLPPSSVSFLKNLEKESARLRSAPSQFTAVLSRVPQVLSSNEFLALWFQSEFTPATVSELVNLSLKDLSASQRAASKKLLHLLESEFAAFTRNLRALLGGSGQDVESLLSCFGILQADHALLRIFCVVILRCLGARPVQVEDFIFSDFWSLDHKYMPNLFETLWQTLPKHDLKLRAELKILLPGYPHKDLITAFKQGANINTERRMWHRKDSRS